MTPRTIARPVAVLGALAIVAGPLAAGTQAAPKAPRKPPAPTITAKPASPTNVRSATFEFTHPTAGVTFQCSLDGAAYETCASPKSYAGPLGEATHTFKVRVRDAAGVLSTASSAAWTIDATPPGAPTLSGVPTPSPTGATTATFTFGSAEAGVTFLCSFDNTAASACASPLELTSVGEGSHTFTVAARDAAGNVGAPAVAAWTVDTTPPPAPSVTTGPANITNDTTATFAIANPDSSATLTCSLDNAAFVACPDPLVYVGLGEGTHTFDVRASDSLGNFASAGTFSWVVDLTAPTPPTILTGPPALSKDAVAQFTFNRFDAVTLLCSVDGGEYAECADAYDTPALADGPHSLLVKGVDAATNHSGATPYNWSVDNTPPPAPTVAGPVTVTNSTSATFTIGNTEPVVSYTCALDGGVASACESGVTYSSLADGPHTLVVSASDSLGNASSASHSWTVDTIAPDATAVLPTVLTGAVTATFTEPVSGVGAASLAMRLSGTTTALAATVSCADAAAAAVSCAAGPVKTAVLQPTTALLPGERYTVVANPSGGSTVADAAGNKLAPKTFAFRAQTQLEETSAAARYTWANVASAASHGGSYRTEKYAGAAASYAFTGTSVTWYSIRARSQGVADVYVDGVRKAVANNYATTTQYKVARTVSGLSAGPHVLKIVVRGVKGSASGTGTWVAVDAVKVGSGAVVATPALTTTWRRSTAAAASGGGMAVADQAAQEVSLRFRGTAISWYTSTGRNRGIVRVYVDGVLKATVDNYAAATAYNVRRTVTGLSDARHTVRIVVTGKHRAAATGNLLAVDRFVVI